MRELSPSEQLVVATRRLGYTGVLRALAQEMRDNYRANRASSKYWSIPIAAAAIERAADMTGLLYEFAK